MKLTIAVFLIVAAMAATAVTAGRKYAASTFLVKPEAQAALHHSHLSNLPDWAVTIGKARPIPAADGKSRRQGFFSKAKEFLIAIFIMFRGVIGVTLGVTLILCFAFGSWKHRRILEEQAAQDKANEELESAVRDKQSFIPRKSRLQRRKQ